MTKNTDSVHAKQPEQTNGHTPGPWELKPEMLYKGQRVAGRSPTVISRAAKTWGRDFAEIARVWSYADAQLIAAAPELLDVCKQFVIQCTLQNIKLGSLIGDAESAIAKAESEPGLKSTPNNPHSG